MFGKIPAFVICGLLGSGKSRLVNRLLQDTLPNESVLLITFEQGNTDLMMGQLVPSDWTHFRNTGYLIHAFGSAENRTGR